MLWKHFYILGFYCNLSTMNVDILQLDSDKLISRLSLGSHVLGRGPILQCMDKRVSRNHALLEIENSNVRLTSTHVNPCFLRAANSKTISILSKDQSTAINDGDSFAFLPEDFWFKVRLNPGQVGDISSSQHSEIELGEPPDKKARLDMTEVNGILKCEGDETAQLNESVLNVTDTVESAERVIQGDIENNVIENPPEESNIQAAEVVQNMSTEEADSPGPSRPPQSNREKCWYGEECYRQNPIHRQEYSHPGDDDYESDSQEKRPICPYGSTCYRTNKDHRKEFKHSHKPKHQRKKRTTRKPRKTTDSPQSAEELSFDEESEAFDDSDADPDWTESQQRKTDSEEHDESQDLL